MKLRTATVFAIVGLALNLLITLGLTLRNWSSAPPPPLGAWMSLFSTVALQSCLLLFFVTLYRKQESPDR